MIPFGLLTTALVTIVGLVAAAMSGVSISPLTWYVARSAGLATYLLFWLATASGLGMTTKLFSFARFNGEKWEIHRLATELAFVMLAAHLISLALDPTVALGLLGVLIPFVSDVRQPWTDLGIVATYGMIIVGGSFGMRRYIGYHGWRLLHVLAFPMWLIALLHGIGAGSDSHAIPVVLMYIATSSSIVYLTLYRLFTARRRGSGPIAVDTTVQDRDRMRQRIAEYRKRCASL